MNIHSNVQPVFVLANETQLSPSAECSHKETSQYPGHYFCPLHLAWALGAPDVLSLATQKCQASNNPVPIMNHQGILFHFSCNMEYFPFKFSNISEEVKV